MRNGECGIFKKISEFQLVESTRLSVVTQLCTIDHDDGIKSLLSSRSSNNKVVMPLKFTKEITTHLFKYVRRVDIRFNRKYTVCSSMDWNKSL